MSFNLRNHIHIEILIMNMLVVIQCWLYKYNNSDPSIKMCDEPNGDFSGYQLIKQIICVFMFVLLLILMCMIKLSVWTCWTCFINSMTGLSAPSQQPNSQYTETKLLLILHAARLLMKDFVCSVGCLFLPVWRCSCCVNLYTLASPRLSLAL